MNIDCEIRVIYRNNRGCDLVNYHRLIAPAGPLGANFVVREECNNKVICGGNWFNILFSCNLVAF